MNGIASMRRIDIIHRLNKQKEKKCRDIISVKTL